MALRCQDYDADNREAAAVILAHVEMYGGEEAGLVQWARLFTRRDEERQRALDADPIPLKVLDEAFVVLGPDEASDDEEETLP